MNLCASPTSLSRSGIRGKRDEGFTLIEILIAIVLVGILSAVAVVGISNLVGQGKTSACTASSDAAKAATAVYYANGNAYPLTLSALASPVSSVAGVLAAPAALALPTNVTAVSNVASGAGWTLTMTTGASGAAPTFACT